MKIMIINGPNINMLGIRETNLYGITFYHDLEKKIKIWAKENNLKVEIHQSNYEGKIIDLAIYMPLNQKINSISGPIIFDVDAITSNKTKLEYGINTGLPMNDETQIVINTDFCDYMSGFPMEFGGLWSVLKKIMPQSYDFNLLALKKKYKGTTRQFVR